MKILAKIIKGHGVASGKNKKSNYPEGTLRLQKAHFLKMGLDLSAYFLGTVNVSIFPWKMKIIKPKYFFEKVKWSKYISPENFYFFDITIFFKEKSYAGLIYLPDPKTKEEHQQKSSTLEILAPFIPKIQYESSLEIEHNEKQFLFYR